jgi:23S rRNA pseudouridine1911/1915/1917 synthase
VGKLIPIIYQDNSIVIVAKPSGLLVVPSDKGGENTLNSYLEQQLDGSVFPCHRLDRDTSGAMIYAKTKESQTDLMNQFRDKKVQKTYIAFVSGKVQKDEGVISDSIVDRKTRKIQTAKTKYRVLVRTNKFTIVEANPLTGRTNQIRIHFANLGHPLLGEDVIVHRSETSLKFRRVALHAFKVEFFHPDTGKRVNYSTPLPFDMKSLLEEWNVKLNKIYLNANEEVK